MVGSVDCFTEIKRWRQMSPAFDVDFFFPRFRAYRGGWFFEPSQSELSSHEFDQDTDTFLADNPIENVEALLNRRFLFDWAACVHFSYEEGEELGDLLEETLGLATELAGLTDGYRIFRYTDEGYPVLCVARHSWPGTVGLSEM